MKELLDCFVPVTPAERRGYARLIYVHPVVSVCASVIHMVQ